MLQLHHPSRPPGLPPAHERSARSAPSARSNMAAVFLLMALAAYGIARYEFEPPRGEHLRSAPASGDTPLAAPFNRPIDLDSTCDGRMLCSQMTSCTEAKAFLRSCPGVLLDRDGNGIPCERSWCNSPLAN